MSQGRYFSSKYYPFAKTISVTYADLFDNANLFYYNKKYNIFAFKLGATQGFTSIRFRNKIYKNTIMAAKLYVDGKYIGSFVNLFELDDTVDLTLPFEIIQHSGYTEGVNLIYTFTYHGIKDGDKLVYFPWDSVEYTPSESANLIQAPSSYPNSIYYPKE